MCPLTHAHKYNQSGESFDNGRILRQLAVERSMMQSSLKVKVKVTLTVDNNDLDIN